MPSRLSLWMLFALSLAHCADLPAVVISSLPSCSFTCLQDYVYLYYTSNCSDTTDLDCLCTHNTPSGFTFGEAALQCLISACTNTASFQQKAYGICDGIEGALPETHSTLTATLMATATVYPGALSGGITSTPSGNVPTSIISGPSATSSTLGASSTDQSSTTTASSSTTSGATAVPQTSPGATPSSSLGSKTGLIAGIAIGALAGVIIILAMAIFLYRKKRRRKEEEEEAAEWGNDVNDKEHPLPPSSQVLRPESRMADAPSQAPPANRSSYWPGKEEKRRSFWRKSIKPEDIGVAVSPEIAQQSPASVASTKTTSKLLPETPRYTIWPSVYNTPEHVDGTTEKRRIADPRRSMNVAEVPKPPPLRIVSSRTGNGMPSDPRAKMYALEKSRSQRDPSRVPLTPVYDNGLPEDWHRAATGAAPRGNLLQVPGVPNVSNAPNVTREPPNPAAFTTQPPSQRLSAPSFHRPGQPMPSRASSRYSNTSESTTFEIDDYDYERDSLDGPIEPSVPQPPPSRSTQYFRPTQSMLSPVAESPSGPPPLPPQMMEDPFDSPTRRGPGGQNSGLGFFPYTSSQQSASVEPTIRLVEATPPSKQLESPKDRAIAAEQSFLASEGTTPEDEGLGPPSNGSEESCSQPSLSSAEAVPGMISRPPPRLLPPYQSPPQNTPQSTRPQPRPDTLLAKRRGPDTTSSTLPQGLRISPDAANRGRLPRTPQQQQQTQHSYPSKQLKHQPSQQQHQQQPSFPNPDPSTTSICHSIGRDRYAATTAAAASAPGASPFQARPAPPPPAPASEFSDDNDNESHTAAVGLYEPKSPFGTRVTPTRKGGDLYLRVG